MTVANSTMKWSAVGAGAVVAVPLTGSQVYDIDDLEVIVRTVADGSETPLTKTTDYTESGIPGAAVTITTVATYTSASEIVVRRVGDFTQTNDFVQADSFPDAVVEQIADEDTMTLQVLNDAVSRAIKFAKTSSESDVEIEDLTASNYLAVNAVGDGIIMVPSASTVDAAVADLLSSSGFGTSIYPALIELTSSGIKLLSGSGSPEGSVVASPGAVYLRTGGAGITDMYQKNTGVDNTGWRSLFRAKYNVYIGTGGDYATLAAYIADSPSAGDRVLWDVSETFSTGVTIPTDVEITQVFGRTLTLDTAIAGAAITINANTRFVGKLAIAASHTGTIVTVVDLTLSNNTIDDLFVVGTGTITNLINIASQADNNKLYGHTANSTNPTNFVNDLSAEKNNDVAISAGNTDMIYRSAGANRFETMTIDGDSVIVETAQSPASGAAGTVGEIAWDASYIYVCTASGVWKRAALTGGY